jgi:hypothetical protein
MKSVAIFFPAVFLDKPQPGEYVRGEDGAPRIACVACGVVQRVDDLRLRWCCLNPSCDATGWVELASAVAN